MPREMVILAVPGVQMLDISGPLDVFAEVNNQMGRKIYHSRVMGLERQDITTSSGVRIMADMLITDPDLSSLDSFLVAGAPRIDDYRSHSGLMNTLVAQIQRSRRYGSVCSGALLLAATGLLDGYRVTTHWAVAGQLAKEYPQVRVEADAICIADGPLRTAAGVTSGLDLALMMVEEDMGHDVALAVAAQLVMFFKRPGGQLQFSRHGSTNLSGRSALQELQRWAISTLEYPHNMQSLAQHIGLSPRHLSRLFKQELDLTPSQWLDQQRISHARHLLESTALAPKQIAAQCGFSSIDILRRAFVRQLNITPVQYRKNHRRV
ncbi:GlxA family transcriptional regulator [Yersinia kristensenii]|uniref:GlxA family transcriptional regulator n=1 Tax=Yersinia kristensenii TaxID=28152 RepID=UPI0038968E88